MSRNQIAVIDYGMGNLLSVFHALEMVGAEAVICTEPEELRSTERIVLPGVGAFGHCMRAKSVHFYTNCCHLGHRLNCGVLLQ